MFGHLRCWYTVYTFWGLLPPQRNFARCKIYFASKCFVLLYWQRYCTALEHWASAKVCGVQQRVQPIFGRVAITLVIGPYSSLSYSETDFEVFALQGRHVAPMRVKFGVHGKFHPYWCNEFVPYFRKR